MTLLEHAKELLLQFSCTNDASAIPHEALMEICDALRAPTIFSGQLDKHGRRDESVEVETALAKPLLIRLAQETFGNDFRPLSPKLHLSHDIDWMRHPPQHHWRAMRRRAWKLRCLLRFDQARALVSQIDAARGADIARGMQELLAAGKGVSRTVFIADSMDHEYDAEVVQGTAAEDVLHDWLQSDDVSLGIHPGFSANSTLRLRSARERIEQIFGTKIEALRYHYLRLVDPEQFAWMSQAGFRFDSSVGFSRQSGARYGLHVPYHVGRDEEVMPIREIPLLFMDFMNNHEALGAIDGFLDWTLQYGAQGAVLIHYGEGKANLVTHLIEGCASREIELVGLSDLVG